METKLRGNERKVKIWEMGVWALCVCASSAELKQSVRACERVCVCEDEMKERWQREERWRRRKWA